MKKQIILALNLIKLKNSKHFFYMDYVRNAIVLYNLDPVKYRDLINAFLTAFEYENRVYQIHDRTFYNQALQKQDVVRDEKFRYIRNLAKLETKSEDSTKAEAAEVVLKVFDLYGGFKIASMSPDSESAVLTNLVEDLQDKYAPQAELLGLSTLVEGLKEANDEYLQIISDRNKMLAEIGKDAVANARSRCDLAYRSLVNTLNSQIEIGMGESLYPFAAYLNVEIERLRQSIGQTTGSGSGSSEGEEEEGPKPVKLKFRKRNGQEIELTGIEGEEFEVPETEEGYIWVSAEGEILAPNGVFPSKDTTYVEVALGDRVKDVFHYLNGEHETFYGNAGTEYQVPATSSDQTIWMPTPTGIFSTVSAQFFETLRPAGGQGEGEQEEGGDQGQGGGEQDGKKKAEWFGPTGELLHTQYYEVGEHIVPPEPPAGYIWNYHPNYMPDYDLEIDCLLDE